VFFVLMGVTLPSVLNPESQQAPNEGCSSGIYQKRKVSRSSERCRSGRNFITTGNCLPRLILVLVRKDWPDGNSRVLPGDRIRPVEKGFFGFSAGQLSRRRLFSNEDGQPFHRWLLFTASGG
jgi:hypothetical protein